MRKWMKLFESRNWQQQIDAGYDEFYQIASEHSDNDFSLDTEPLDLSREQYHKLAITFANDPPKQLFRGMTISQSVLENATHLGIYYAESRNSSEVFAHGGDVYDERFIDADTEGSVGIVIEVEPVPLNSIDAPVTLAMAWFGESEVKLLENEPIRIKNITDPKGQPIWQHLWGADYLT